MSYNGCESVKHQDISYLSQKPGSKKKQRKDSHRWFRQVVKLLMFRGEYERLPIKLAKRGYRT